MMVVLTLGDIVSISLIVLLIVSIIVSAIKNFFRDKYKQDKGDLNGK